MHLQPFLGLPLAVLLVCSAYPSFAQVVPAANEGRLPLSVGAGVSSFDPDWEPGRMLGITAWVDYTPGWMPRRLRGIGIEAEGRDINYGRSSSQPANLREDVAAGGVIYTWYRFHNFRPYGKYLMGIGNTDYESKSLAREHDSRTVTIAGGGVEARIFRNVWARADYEYQFWPDFFKSTNPPGLLNPQGVTVGASYHFNHPHFH
jgi:opacity protein-like surface antigen